MTDETHCGYKNYETFTVAVWMDNDADQYAASRGIVREAPAGEPDRDPIPAAADALKAWFEEGWIEPITESDRDLGPAGTLLSAALSEVDWYELAEGILDDIAEFEKAEEEHSLMFTLRIETDNAAFHSDDPDDKADAAEEIARLLSVTMAHLEEGRTEGTLMDANGNTVGTYKLER